MRRMHVAHGSTRRAPHRVADAQPHRTGEVSASVLAVPSSGSLVRGHEKAGVFIDMPMAWPAIRISES